MDNLPISNVNVSLTIPSARVQAAAMDVFDMYKPIVEDALKEVREKLLFDDSYRNTIRGLVIQRTEEVMKEAIEKAARNVVDDVFYTNYKEMTDIMKKAIMDKMNKEEMI